MHQCSAQSNTSIYVELRRGRILPNRLSTPEFNPNSAYNGVGFVERHRQLLRVPAEKRPSRKLTHYSGF